MSNHRSDLIKVTIHRSLVRRKMFLGGERTVVITTMIFCGYMAYLLTFSYGFLWGVTVAGTLWMILLFLARLAAQSDEQMWQVVKRHLKYRAFYPAQGRFGAPVPPIHELR
jgi:type IV secretory pathway TrbD component